MNSGSTTIIEYMPKPKRNADTFVHHTIGVRIRRTSTSGKRERSSTQTHAANRIAATTKRPSTRAEVQPQSAPMLTPRSSATSHPDSNAAAPKLTVPAVFTGDSGTNRNVATVARAVITSGIQKSQ